MRFFLFGATCILIGCSHTQPLATSSSGSIVSDVVCPELSGFLDGPFVRDEATARKIAEAIINSIENRNPDDRYVLKIVDDGSHWEAFQSLRSNEDATENGDILTVTAGGGGVEMRIAKCDGAVSEVHFIR